MRRIRACRTAVTLALGAVLTLSCAVQDTASSRTPEAAAQALADLSIELGSLEQALDRATTAAWESAEPPLVLQLGRELSDDERDWVQGMLRATLAEYMTREIWRDAITEIFSPRFTADEIEQLIRFYSSPLGRKVLELGDELDMQVDLIIRGRLDARVEEFIARVDEELAAKFESLGGGS